MSCEKMNPGRILGVIAGIIILIAVFALPFLSLPSDLGITSPSLYGIASSFLGSLGLIQQSGNQTLIALAYVLIVAFILLTIAGVVGFFPLGSGVIGIIAMAIVTVAPFVIFPQLQLGLSSAGIGYFVAWAASILALAASFWKARAAPPINVTVNAPPPPPPIPPTEVVVSPTISLTQTQIAGEGRPVRPESQTGQGETTPLMVAKTIDSLKEKKASGEITAEKFQEELGKLMFRDASGKFWTVDYRTGHWVYHDGTKWVEGTPPPTLTGI
jgi:hypothetical protein